MNIRRSDLLAATMLFLAVALFFLSAGGYGLLQWDDQYHLTNNPFLQPDSASRYLHFWQAPYGKLYVPITYNAWASLYAHCFDPAGRFSPRLLHLANVIFHALNSVLVYVLLRLLVARVSNPCSTTPAIPASVAVLLGALFFALHPLQVESVAWISELRGLLASFFGLAATIVYVIQREPERPKDPPVGSCESTTRSFGRSGSLWMTSRTATAATSGDTRAQDIAASLAASLLLAIALLSKPSVAALPLVWLVLDRLWFARPWRAIAARLALPVVLVAGSTVLMRSLQTAESIPAGSPWLRPFIAGDTLVFYLSKLAWPFGLCADYSRTPTVVAESAAIWIAWIVPALLLFAGMVLRNHSRDRVILPSVLIFIAALAPVLGLVPFEFQHISTVADRYAYLALLGPSLLIVAIAREGRAQAAAMLCLVALLAWRTSDQLPTWRDDASLWTHAAAVNPRAAIATSNLAQQAADRGDAAEARRLYERVVEIAPKRGNGHRGLGRLAADAGDLAAALRHYEAAIAADPADALAMDGTAEMLAALGRLDEAEARLRDAVRVDPTFVNAWNNLGALLARQGRQTDAIKAFEQATALHPRYPAAWFNRALTEDAIGNATRAADALRQGEAITKAPSPLIRRLLGSAALRRGDWTGAERWHRLTLEADPADIVAWNELGQSLARQGRLDDAIAAFERAIELRPDLAALRENLEAARRLQRGSPPRP